MHCDVYSYLTGLFFETAFLFADNQRIISRRYISIINSAVVGWNPLFVISFQFVFVCRPMIHTGVIVIWKIESKVVLIIIKCNFICIIWGLFQYSTLVFGKNFIVVYKDSRYKQPLVFLAMMYFICSKRNQSVGTSYKNIAISTYIDTTTDMNTC